MATSIELIQKRFLAYLEYLSDPQEAKLFATNVFANLSRVVSHNKNFYKVQDVQKAFYEDTIARLSGKTQNNDIAFQIAKKYSNSPLGIFDEILLLDDASDIFIVADKISIDRISQRLPEVIEIPHALQTTYENLVDVLRMLTHYASSLQTTKYDPSNPILDYDIQGLRFNVVHHSLNAMRNGRPIITVRHQVLSTSKKSSVADNYISKLNLSEAQLKTIQDLAFNGSFIICGVTGSGKEEPNSMPVLAEHGWKPIGEIRVGDKVWTPKGTLTEVTGVFPQGVKDVYELKTVAGQRVECGLEHLWGVYCNTHGNLTYQVLSTKQMLEKGIIRENVDYRGTCHTTHKFALPVSKAIPFEKKKLPCDPYVLGAVIGDGCCTSKQFCISSDDQFVINEIAKRIGAIDYRQGELTYAWYFYNKPYKKNQKNSCIQTSDILGDVPEVLCCAINKHVPDIYKFSSLEQRWELIQGLFDTDGCCSLRNDRKAALKYSTVSQQLAEDIREILYSLGIESRIKTLDRRGKTHISAGKEYIRKSVEYEVIVCCPKELYPQFFTLPRKLEKAKEMANKFILGTNRRNYSMVNVESIKKLDKQEESTCIKVADEDELYITKDYIVTHNTTLLRYMANHRLGEKRNLVTIEDTAELFLDTRISYLTNDKLNIHDLFKVALRENPSHMLIGETRNEEIVDILESSLVFNTGTTVHADSFSKLIMRIVFMVKNARPAYATEDIMSLFTATMDGVIVMRDRKIQEIYKRKKEYSIQGDVLKNYEKIS